MKGQNAASSSWADEVVARVATTIQAHDEHWPGVWLCGSCPYMNVGPICTKCGAPCYEGEFVGGVAV